MIDRLKRHPMVIVIGTLMAVIAGTGGFVLFFANQIQDNAVAVVERQLADERSAHKDEVADLNRSLSSIQRSLGSDSDYVDV